MPAPRLAAPRTPMLFYIGVVVAVAALLAFWILATVVNTLQEIRRDGPRAADQVPATVAPGVVVVHRP